MHYGGSRKNYEKVPVNIFTDIIDERMRKTQSPTLSFQNRDQTRRIGFGKLADEKF
jgi:hypothetical protein